MKSEYFKSESIEKKTSEMLAKIEWLGGRHEVPLIPEKSALLVIDMQRYFLEKESHAYIPSAAAIVPGLKKLILEFISQKRPVTLTRHIDTADQSGPMARWWKRGIKKGSPYSEIIEDLYETDCKIIEKSQYDAFLGTSLEDFLKENDVLQLIICGVMTHLCCESTARSAFMRDLDVFFTIDGTATYNEDFHLASLLNLSHGFAVPVTVDEILTRLKAANEN
ncbi:MAG: isochorismatase family cysteine hydrolase [candidate division Zixibacteria bacterium]